MFADSLLDSPWPSSTRRSWTTLVAFAIEAVVVAGLVALPLFYTNSLPQLRLMSALLVPAVPAPLPVTPVVTSSGHQTVPTAGVWIVHPLSVHHEISAAEDSDLPPSLESVGVHAPSGTGEASGSISVLNSLGTGHPIVGPPPTPVHSAPLRVSRMMEGNLIDRVQPQYPSLARQARIQGIVVLRAVISRDGKIENLQIMSGHPMLVQAAMDAVRQWRYRPYYLNNEPVEVETQVTVNFTLSGG